MSRHPKLRDQIEVEPEPEQDLPEPELPTRPARPTRTEPTEPSEEEQAQIEAFKTDVENAFVNAEYDYYNNVPPRPLPEVPQRIDESGNMSGQYLIPASRVPFRFLKTTLPNGKTYLSVVYLGVELA